MSCRGYLILLCFALATQNPSIARELTIQERLGYPANAKLLIIHGDDLGMAHSQNAATFRAMAEGVVTSASVMMPAPWVLEVAKMSAAHPEADLGLHLTLTAEWKNYKWGPLLGKDAVPSLVTEEGVFHSNVPAFAAAAKIEEVEREIRAQIAYAQSLGLNYSHFDHHMGAMTATDELTDLYLRLGDEYAVPLRLHHNARTQNDGESLPARLAEYPIKLDAIYAARPKAYPDNIKEYYNRALRGLEPGLNLIVLHLANDSPEMRATTANRSNWGAAWRQIDLDWATDPAVRQLIEKTGIILIDWRSIKERLFRKDRDD